jgi:hypothetical protein
MLEVYDKSKEITIRKNPRDIRKNLKWAGEKP